MTEAPYRFDYPTYEAYLRAFDVWRAVQRENRLNDEELAVQWEVTEEYLRRRLEGMRSNG